MSEKLACAAEAFWKPVSAGIAVGEQRALHPFLATAIFEKNLRQRPAITVGTAAGERKLDLLCKDEIGESLDGIDLGRPGPRRGIRVACPGR